MLKQLKIKDFAIIDDITVFFNTGFTTLTGETGAGKSLIIDAIGLLFGLPTNSYMIRSGKQRAVVEGKFIELSDQCINILKLYNIPLINEEVVINIEINIKGKDIVIINNKKVSNKTLEVIGGVLGSIHSQHDSAKILFSNNLFYLLDDDHIKDKLLIYREIRKKYYKALQEYQKLVSCDESDKLEFIQYQYDELCKANLIDNEEEELEKEFQVLNNFEVINSLINEIKNSIYQNKIDDTLYSIVENLSKLKEFDSNFDTYQDKLMDSYYLLKDLNHYLDSFQHTLDYDEERLNYINNRFFFIKSLKQKYKKNYNQLIQFRGDLRAKIQDFESRDDKILGCKNNVEILYSQILSISSEISRLRQENSQKLRHFIIEHLYLLNIKYVNIDIIFKEIEYGSFENKRIFTPYGCDDIDFLVSFNEGEPPKLISKVISGGELSRLMFVVKLYLFQQMKFSTIIFDEIDTGVSGIVLEKMGELVEQLSHKVQIIMISHNPLMVLKSNHQLNVSKQIKNDNTVIKIDNLNIDQKIKVISEMMNPNDQTNKTQEFVKNMIKNNI